MQTLTTACSSTQPSPSPKPPLSTSACPSHRSSPSYPHAMSGNRPHLPIPRPHPHRPAVVVAPPPRPTGDSMRQQLLSANMISSPPSPAFAPPATTTARPAAAPRCGTASAACGDAPPPSPRSAAAAPPARPPSSASGTTAADGWRRAATAAAVAGVATAVATVVATPTDTALRAAVAAVGAAAASGGSRTAAAGAVTTTAVAAAVPGGSVWAGVNAALLKRVPTKALAAALTEAALVGVSAAASAGAAGAATDGGSPSVPLAPVSPVWGGRVVKRKRCRMPGAPPPPPRSGVAAAAARLPAWTPRPCSASPAAVAAPTDAASPLVNLVVTTAGTAAAVALTYPLHAAYYAATRSVDATGAGATAARLLPAALSFLRSAPRSALYAGLGPAVAAAVAVPAAAAPFGGLALPRIAVTIAARAVGEPLRAATRAAAAGGGVPLELYKGFGRRCVRYAVASATAGGVRSALRHRLPAGGASPVAVAPFALR